MWPIVSEQAMMMIDEQAPAIKGRMQNPSDG
jgi:hypothetical protein